MTGFIGLAAGLTFGPDLLQALFHDGPDLGVGFLAGTLWAGNARQSPATRHQPPVALI
jgi:hypothetical protein